MVVSIFLSFFWVILTITAIRGLTAQARQRNFHVIEFFPRFSP